MQSLCRDVHVVQRLQLIIEPEGIPLRYLALVSLPQLLYYSCPTIKLVSCLQAIVPSHS